MTESGICFGDENGIARVPKGLYIGDPNGLAKKINGIYTIDEDNHPMMVYSGTPFMYSYGCGWSFDSGSGTMLRSKRADRGSSTAMIIGADSKALGTIESNYYDANCDEGLKLPIGTKRVHLNAKYDGSFVAFWMGVILYDYTSKTVTYDSGWLNIGTIKSTSVDVPLLNPEHQYALYSNIAYGNSRTESLNIALALIFETSLKLDVTFYNE